MKELPNPYEIPEGIKEESLILNGKRVHYLEGGKGEAVLFVHGWLNSSDGFKKIISNFPKNYHCFAPDLPGFGIKNKASDDMDYKEDIYAYVDFIHSFLKEKKLSKAGLVGTSFGATICLEFALKYPNEVSKLVIFEPSLGGKDLSISVRFMLKLSRIRQTWKLLRWIVVQGVKLDKLIISSKIDKENQDTMLLEYKGGSLRAAAESAQDLEKGIDFRRYKEINCPTLLIYTNLKNPFASKKTMGNLSKVIRNIKVISKPEFSHVFIRENPGKFSQLVIDFLEE